MSDESLTKLKQKTPFGVFFVFPNFESEVIHNFIYIPIFYLCYNSAMSVSHLLLIII